MNRQQRRAAGRGSGSSVCVAYVHDLTVTHSFHSSLIDLLFYDAARHARMMRGGWIRMRCGTGGLVEARNQTVARFLEAGTDWLFWLDTDMGFAADTVDRLCDAAHPADRPIVGALCFAQKETALDGYGGYRCSPRVTIFDYIDVDGVNKFAGVTSYPEDTVVRCAGTGSACILIHRSVFEKIAAEYGPTWYTRIADGNGELLGEDISFCVRATALNLPIHVHTGVKTTHMKTIWLAEEDFLTAHALGAAHALG